MTSYPLSFAVYNMNTSLLCNKLSYPTTHVKMIKKEKETSEPNNMHCMNAD